MLKKIFTFFQENDLKVDSYLIPGLWVNHTDSELISLSMNDFYLDKLGEILICDKRKNYHQSLSQIDEEHHGIGGDWSYHSVVYNSFCRFTTAFDHNDSGDLRDYSLHGLTIRKTGTFLKLIALLPYLKRMGINTLHLMPVTKTSASLHDRGNLASPYATKNPYELDDRLAEPSIPFSVDDQFLALTEACHMLDMRIILEFVLRTASLDSDWIKEHPEWFYWINKENKSLYKSPDFSATELEKIKKIPAGNGEFIQPAEAYRNLFRKAPGKQEIHIHGNEILATSNGEDLTVPGAFADWPPDDEQPPWNDVTYLKMFKEEGDEEKFNYKAYDTLRYYNPELAQEKNINHGLWDALKGIIPHYQRKFGIDGIMLDMGHALPKQLLKNVIEEARNVDADFAFWEENFELLSSSRSIGFNAALGFEWKFKEHDAGLRQMLITAAGQLPLPFFGTPETHNTPRITDIKIKKQYAILNSFLPSCIPFYHNGYELDEQHPVNTGLNFTAEQIEFYKDYPLPLFNRASMNWTSNRNIVGFIQKIARLREKNKIWLATGDERTLTIHYPENSFGKVIAFERHDAYQPWKSILIVMNTNLHSDEKFFLNLHGTFNNSYNEYLSNSSFAFEDHWLSSELEAGEILIFEMHKLI